MGTKDLVRFTGVCTPEQLSGFCEAIMDINETLPDKISVRRPTRNKARREVYGRDGARLIPVVIQKQKEGGRETFLYHTRDTFILELSSLSGRSTLRATRNQEGNFDLELTSSKGRSSGYLQYLQREVSMKMEGQESLSNGDKKSPYFAS